MLDDLDKALQKAFTIEHITLEDQAYFHRGHHPDRKGGHYSITLVSDDFENLSTIKRHQKIYAALNMPSNKNIHAMSLSVYTVKEWQNAKAKDAKQ